jgi:hypothetical protein
MIDILRFDVSLAERIMDLIHARDKFHQEAVPISKSKRLRDAWLEVLGGRGDDLDTSGLQFLIRLIDFGGRSYLKSKVVHAARSFGFVKRQHVVARSFGAEKHLASVLIDPLQTPPVVVELSLPAQVVRIESNMREFDHSNHRGVSFLRRAPLATAQVTPERSPDC